jgi:hypothetical protein
MAEQKKESLLETLAGVHGRRLAGDPEKEPYKSLIAQSYIQFMGASSWAFAACPNPTGEYHYALTKKGMDILFPPRR